MEEACVRCAAPITWIDAARACPDGLLHCLECADELGGQCADCSGALRRRAPRARAFPGQPA